MRRTNNMNQLITTTILIALVFALTVTQVDAQDEETLIKTIPD